MGARINGRWSGLNGVDLSLSVELREGQAEAARALVDFERTLAGIGSLDEMSGTTRPASRPTYMGLGSLRQGRTLHYRLLEASTPSANRSGILELMGRVQDSAYYDWNVGQAVDCVTDREQEIPQADPAQRATVYRRVEAAIREAARLEGWRYGQSPQLERAGVAPRRLHVSRVVTDLLGRLRCPTPENLHYAAELRGYGAVRRLLVVAMSNSGYLGAVLGCSGILLQGAQYAVGGEGQASVDLELLSIRDRALDQELARYYRSGDWRRGGRGRGRA